MATLQQQYKTYGLACFEKYRDFQPINETELDVAVNYICEHLNSPTLNYGYWYDMYSYTTKSKIVLRYRKRRGGSPVVKLGECLCQGQVVDFLKNSNKNATATTVARLFTLIKFFSFFLFRILKMDKTNIFIFAGISSAVLFSCGLLVYCCDKRRTWKNIRKEIAEAIEEINNDNSRGNDSTEK